MGYLKVTSSAIRMPAKVTASASLRRCQSKGASRRTAACERQDSLAWRRPACPCADRAALRSGKLRSRRLRSRESGSSRRRGSEVRDPAAGAAGTERSGCCFADRPFAAGHANADRRAHPRRAPAERAVRRHDVVRRDPHDLAVALAQDSSNDLAFGAGFGRRCPSAGETASSARTEVRAEARRRGGQRSDPAPRAAERTRGGT